MEIINDLHIGSHVSMKAPEYLVGSIKEALGYNANSFMIYTGAPQSTTRTQIQNLKISEFRKIAEQNNISIENVIVHAPYILNLANADPTKRKFVVDFLVQEIKRTLEIGAKYFVLHPGNATNCSVEEGIKNIANRINEVFQKIGKTDVVICLETMSGKGTEIGKNFNELKSIIDKVNYPKNIGVCLDTCHINDSGYQIENFDEIIDEFNKIIGIDKLKVVHLNDSKNPINAHKDRHENIGYGTLGFDNILKVVYHPKLTSIPKILETPWFNGKPYYKQEIQILRNKKWEDFRK